MTARERRVVTLGAAVAGVVFLVRLAGLGRAEAVERIAQLVQLEALLVRAETLAREAPALPDTLAARSAGLVGRTPLLLEGRTVAEAVANLSALANGWAAVHGIQVSHIVPREDVTPGPLVPVEVLVRGRGDLEGLVGLVAALDRGPALLVIERLTVDREPAAGRAQTLGLELVVRGWALVREER